jgi:peptidoglycan hydrolase CwlO-like protein
MSNETNGNSNKIIIGILVFAIIGSWIYFYSLNNKNIETVAQKDTRIEQIDNSRKELQAEFDLVSAKVDSLTSTNTLLSGDLLNKTNEIIALKANIGSILGKEKASKAEIAEAKKMIASLNTQITNLTEELAKAQAENKELTVQNGNLNTQNQNLNLQNSNLNSNLSSTTKEKDRIQDIASTLHASSFTIQALRIKDNGSEKVTNNTRKANTIRLSFQIDKNRITPSGSQDLFVCITGPDGKTVGEGGSFSSREDGQKAYSNKITVQYEQNAVLPVSYDIKQGSRLAEGDYKIEVYNNGFKIGEGRTTMKKSLF